MVFVQTFVITGESVTESKQPPSEHDSSSEADSLESDTKPHPPSARPQLPYTSTGRNYRLPRILSSLKNSTTRYGSRGAYVRTAGGIVPSIDNDMYQQPEYRTPSYVEQYTDPNKK